MEPVLSRIFLRRLPAALLPVTLVLACGALLGACGGDSAEGDVEGLLDRAFRNSITSANLKIDAQLNLDGLKGFERPIRLEASGPYIGGGRGLPKLDIDLSLGAQGAGQSVQFGLLRTADRAFVKFGGEFYEQSRREVERANRELAARGGRRGGTLRDLGLTPRTWVVGAREEGEETVAGARVQHVSGRLDIRSVLRDLNELVRRSASLVGRAPGDAPEPLSPQELDRIAETVRNPSFDVYVGKEDDVIRRLSAQLDVRVPEGDRAGIGGIERGAMRVSIEFSDLRGAQTVNAPPSARPLGDLTRQLGGLSALEGVGAPEGDSGQGRARPRRPAAPTGEQGTGQADPGAEGVEAFRRYSDCLDRAGPDDTKALSRCAELLR